MVVAGHGKENGTWQLEQSIGVVVGHWKENLTLQLEQSVVMVDTAGHGKGDMILLLELSVDGG